MIKEINDPNKRNKLFFRYNVIPKVYLQRMNHFIKPFFIACFTLLALLKGIVAYTQEELIQDGEFGLGIGSGHYFGDLNPDVRLNRPKVAATAFFRKNFNNYIAARIGATYAQLGYADKYYQNNEFMRLRNLSFNTKVWELTLQGDFNFFKFMPGDPYESFTPYLTFGIGVLSYDPYAYLRGEKVFLRPLGTEGQNTGAYAGRRPYTTTAFNFPFGGGIKFAINDRYNIGLEVLYRTTTTDYLDDVSKTYVDPGNFAPNPDGTPSQAQLLNDRSYELGSLIGYDGKQRGISSKQKDQYVTAMFHISFNLQSYRCPKAR